MITRIQNTPNTQNFKGIGRRIDAMKIMAGTCMIAGTLGILAAIDTKITNNRYDRENKADEFKRALNNKTKALENYATTDTSLVSRAKTQSVLFSKPYQKFHISPQEILELETNYLNQKACSVRWANRFGDEMAKTVTPTANYLKELQKFKMK